MHVISLPSSSKHFLLALWNPWRGGEEGSDLLITMRKGGFSISRWPSEASLADSRTISPAVADIGEILASFERPYELLTANLLRSFISQSRNDNDHNYTISLGEDVYVLPAENPGHEFRKRVSEMISAS